MAKVVRVRYENGVLKPLEKLDLVEGEELEIIIRRIIDIVLDRYIGVFGEADVEELERIEEEAQYQ